jgi:DNA-binding Xre family transcriptional regulator
MSSSQAPKEFQMLLSTARQIMKARRMTYAMLAKRIAVSEATVKRTFTSADASFSRVVEICNALGIAFADLVQQAQDQRENVFVLTFEQENYFATHPSYYAFLRALLETHGDLKELLQRLKLNESSTMKYLRKLEELKLLDRLPKGRIKLKVDGTHNWLDGGPFQKKFLKTDNRDFIEYLSTAFQQERHYMTTSDRHIHPDTFNSLLSDLKGLASQYRKRAYRDELYYPKKDLIQVKWLIGAAPYQRKWDDLIENL